MSTITIRTRYTTRPGSNVGTYRATGGGRTFTAPPRLDIEAREREEIAARALASILSGFDPGNVREWARRVDVVMWEARRGDVGAGPARPEGEPIPPEHVSLWRESGGDVSLFPSAGKVTTWTVKL